MAHYNQEMNVNTRDPLLAILAIHLYLSNLPMILKSQSSVLLSPLTMLLDLSI